MGFPSGSLGTRNMNQIMALLQKILEEASHASGAVVPGRVGRGAPMGCQAHLLQEFPVSDKKFYMVCQGFRVAGRN